MTSSSNCNLLSSSKTTGEEDHHTKHQPQSFPSQTHTEEVGKDQVRERIVLLQGEGRTASARGRGGGNNDNTRLQLQSQEESVTSTASEEMMKRDDSGREQDDDGRERLKRHRNEMAGRVRIPEIWGQEDFLKEWMDCTVFDALLAPAGLISARAALVREGGCRVVSSSKLRYT